MRDYFEAWIKYFRDWCEIAVRTIDWKGDIANQKIREQAIKNVELYHNINVREKYTPTEFDRFINGCKIVELPEPSAEEVFADRKAMIEGGHVTYSDWDRYNK